MQSAIKLRRRSIIKRKYLLLSANVVGSSTFCVFSSNSGFASCQSQTEFGYLHVSQLWSLWPGMSFFRVKPLWSCHYWRTLLSRRYERFLHAATMNLISPSNQTILRFTWYESPLTRMVMWLTMRTVLFPSLYLHF